MAKKIVALLLAMAMLLSFAACGEDPTDPTTPSTPVNPTNPTDPTPSDPTDPTDPAGPAVDDPWAAYECITVAEALAMQLTDGEMTTERFYLRGTVAEMLNVMYGEMTLADETGSIYVYGTYSADGELRYSEMADKAFAGDEVLLHCIISNYQGTIQVKNARLIDYIRAEVSYDESDYVQMTVAEVREADKNTKVKVTGVVAQITYANGKVPSGVILVDGTSSIYVYDSDIAARVAIGNEITVLASKTYWILETEQTNAEKFGYIGCNQLENATLISNDEGKQEFDKSWIETTTVKDIMDTPVTEDITTKIFKVTAQVKKVEGTGFVNYYINDLDGYTGSYTYTQCSGSDFAWLDEFDGKICTVYVVALNAKSSASGCVWRFLPVAVVDEGFNPETVNFAENAVKYYGVGQFLPQYTGDPAMELLTSADNALLGYTGAVLSYVSSDPSVISVEGNVMHCHKTGTAVITVTAEHNGVTYSEDVTIAVSISQENLQGMTVADAIAAAVGDTVTVKGIVGPSLVNKDGFYLIDETGIIAVLVDTATLATLEIGYEVVLEGERDFHSKSGGNWGTTCIDSVKVVTNNYGAHEYSTASFDGPLTLAEWVNLSTDVDYTTSVFLVSATVEVVETPYYTNIKLVDGNVSINLYCSGAQQYKWLQAFAGQTITMELIPCNWSSKSTYPACVLAVVHEDGTKTLNTLNFN